ncbi:hypothetical protein LBMAG42_34990 [Deltaproteobacteria bacterium]|nr:hypothetical protein LBMAG42_34990 [Deltaproteobacteria bacterium]
MIRALAPLLLLGCTAGTTPGRSRTETMPTWPTTEGPPTLFGFWGINAYSTVDGLADLNARFGMTVVQRATEEPHWAVTSLLPTFRGSAVKLTLRLSGDHPAYTSGNDDFDLAMWKAALERWKDSGIQPFIDDGTLIGHMLIDDVQNFTGHDPDGAELDEMARYSKELFPGLMTYVRLRATDMPEPAGGKYLYLDAQVNQYESWEGEIHAYAEAQAARARELDLRVINGMNIADGGDGSSGKAGYRADHWAMSATEISDNGAVLAAIPSCGMFLNWEYDGEERWADGSIGADYFNQPELQAALAELGGVVAAHPYVELRRE